MTCHHFLQILLFPADQNNSLDSTGNLWPLNDYQITLISGLVEAMGELLALHEVRLMGCSGPGSPQGHWGEGPPGLKPP